MVGKMTCFVCGAPAVELHHILVPQYKRYGDWVHAPCNMAPVCKQCHIGSGEAKSYVTRMRWIETQDKDELLAWLDAAPYEARYRVAEVRRMVNGNGQD